MPSKSCKLEHKKKISKKHCSTGPCCMYDFTLFDKISVDEVRKTLKDLCKKYCFQLEKGENTGKEHYQGRFSLKIKKRINELAKLLSSYWTSFHISITSSPNKGNNFYVMKEETRISGPYTEENDVYIPLDIRKIQQLKPWQATLREMLKTYDERIVDILYDKNGGIGKTSLVRYMMLYDDAEMLPFCNDYKDIMRMAYDVGPKRVYLIDMPRALEKHKLAQFFAGIETLRSGYCYDDRYKFQKRLFDRPRICIFTNVKPNKNLLSKDMWRIWEVKGNELSRYNGNCIINPSNIEFVSTDEEIDNQILFDNIHNEEQNECKEEYELSPYSSENNEN